MEYIYDAPFSDVFRCDGELEFHDYHFVSPFETIEPSYLYRVYRTAIERVLPRLFEVERSANTRYCEIFCILSGQGSLTYSGRTYLLRRNQLVLLPAREAHQYKSNPDDPMGTVWLEFYGANAEALIRHLVDLHGPVLEGTLFADVCAQLCLIQQRLMINAYYQPSLEIYRVLLTMLQHSEIACPLRLSEDRSMNFLLAEAYINAHMSRKNTNSELAQVCGVSLPHFIKEFKAHYRQTPQAFIMDRRLQKAAYTLLNTSLSVDSIAESLGFCNTSHFIRRFSEVHGMTPMRYRRQQRHHD